jgi:hypothetical protein
MMSFLTYITGFFMNFEVLPILTDYEIKKKGGKKFKKKHNFKRRPPKDHFSKVWLRLAQ